MLHVSSVGGRAPEPVVRGIQESRQDGVREQATEGEGGFASEGERRKAESCVRSVVCERREPAQSADEASVCQTEYASASIEDLRSPEMRMRSFATT